VGKTTLVKKVVASFPGCFRGFYTEEIRDRERLGFAIVTLSGKKGILAHREGVSPFEVGRYKVFVRDFEALVLPELEEAFEKRKPLLVDEVGKMELLSSAFAQWFHKAWYSALPIVVTSFFPPLLQVAHYWEGEGVRKFVLHPHNRTAVTETLFALLASQGRRT